MSRRIARHLTYANVMATLALFVALGGTAYAAATIGSADVVNESLVSADLKDDAAVRSSDVRDDTLPGGGLEGVDIAKNTLTGNDIAEGTLGRVPRAKRAGVSGYERVYGGNTPLAANTVSPLVSADCPSGKVAVGGGFWTDSAAVETMWAYVTDDNTYTATFWNSDPSNQHTVGVHVVCVDAG